MAKSLRSKRKRKMRAIKRVRYGEKEEKRLNDMISRSIIRKNNDKLMDSSDLIINSQMRKTSFTSKNCMNSVILLIIFFVNFETHVSHVYDY